MIIVQLLGGMGNQMFQYAAGRQLAIKNNAPLKLDTSTLMDWTPGRHAVNRSFDLDIFNLVAVIANKKEISSYNSQLMNKAEKIIFHAKRKMGFSHVCKEKYFHFDAGFLELKGDQYLAGLWQSYKYFEDIEDVIRKDFEVTQPMNDNAKQLLGKIKNSNSVCINIRRTDYVSVKQTADALGFIGLDYYEAALKVVFTKVEQPHFFIFSDDIAWCNENLKIEGYPVMYVDHSYAGNKFSDYFQLMISCKHYIIPNSTFAWWAAWLNNDKQKTVVTPVKWMTDPAVNTTDLIPPSWIRL